MKGKFISIFLTVSILCSLCSMVSADPDCKVTVNGTEPAYTAPKSTPMPMEQPVDKSVIRVLLNGQRIDFDVDPVIINDRTMVPLRAIGEALQAKVDWEEATETITITKGDVVNTLKLGDVNAYKTVNGKQETIVLETAPFTKNDRTLVPLRYLSESFDMQVEWVEEENMVRITSKDLPTPKPSPTASPKPTATPKPIAKPTPTPVPTPKSLQGTGKAMKSIDFSKDTKGEMLELHFAARYAFEQYNLPELMFMNVDDVYDAYFTAQRAISSFINDIWTLTTQAVFQNSNSLEMREAFSGTTSQSQRDSITQKYQREKKLLASDCYRITYESGNGLYAIILDMADIDTMPIGSFIGIVFDNQGNMMYYVLEQSTDGVYMLCGRDRNGEHLNYGILEHSREAFVNAILKRE